LEKLQKTMKSREVQRKQKLSKLKEVVEEGEKSVAKIHESISQAATTNAGYDSRSPTATFRTTFHFSPHQSPTSKHGKGHGSPDHKPSRQENRNMQHRLVNIKTLNLLITKFISFYYLMLRWKMSGIC